MVGFQCRSLKDSLTVKNILRKKKKKKINEKETPKKHQPENSLTLYNGFKKYKYHQPIYNIVKSSRF